MIENRALVFDLVGTLVPFMDQEFGVRFGTRQLFEEYQQAGNSVFVTTSDSTPTARDIVKKAALTAVVKDSLSVSAGKGKGKVYQAIADIMGYDPEEVSQKMLIHGDSMGDAPNDLEGVVLVYHRDAYLHDAQVHKIVASRLYDAGKGHFGEGFEILAEQEKGNYGIELGDSIKVTTDKIHFKGVFNPVVTVLEAPQWKRSLVRSATSSAFRR